jgi:hypothetical protein
MLRKDRGAGGWSSSCPCHNGMRNMDRVPSIEYEAGMPPKDGIVRAAPGCH